MCTPAVITIECCGLLVGSTSEEIAEHIEKAWATGMPHFTSGLWGKSLCFCASLYFVLLSCRKGQECITLLRDELGIEFADLHVPLINGGVLLHKLQGVMHDTCNTANKTARLAKSLRNTSGRLHFEFDRGVGAADRRRQTMV
jgi:hypothetical protein